MIAWVVGTLGVTLAFVTLAAYNLGTYRPVSNDEVELIAVSYKLVRQGPSFRKALLANPAVHGDDLRNNCRESLGTTHTTNNMF